MSSRDKARGWIALFALVLVVAATYHSLLQNRPVWDDVWLIFGNPSISSWRRVGELFATDLWTASGKQEPSDFYRPMTMVTFLVNRMVGGESPASYHVGNIVLHLATCSLLYLLASSRAREPRGVAPFFAAACFALAPIVSEPVIWMSGRFDLLAALFAVLAVLIHKSRGLLATIAVPFVFIAGMLCKENAVIIPLLLGCDDLIRRRLLSRVSMIRFGSIAVLFAGYLLMRQAVGVATGAAASGAGAGELLRAYWLNVSNSIALLVWPYGLDPFHPYAPPGWPATILWATACLLPLVVLTLHFRRYPDRERTRTALLGLLWFLIAFGPVIATGPRLQMMGDRYAYLPMVGLFLAVNAGVDYLQERLSGGATQRVLYGVVGGLLIWFSITTHTRIADWKDEPTLFRASLRSHAANPYALYSLGVLALDRGALNEAEPLLLESLTQRSDAWRTHNALCVVYLRRRELRKAEGYCRSSLELNPQNPRTWVNLASIHAHSFRWEEALGETDQALALKPHYAEGQYLRGVSLANLGRVDEARATLQRALEIDPNHVGARDLVRKLGERPGAPGR